MTAQSSKDAPEVIPWERFQKEAERGLDISAYITSMNAHILNQRDEINRLRPAAESWESYVAAQERKGQQGETPAERPLVYTPCALHMGQWFTMTVGIGPTPRAVCPICNPPDALHPKTGCSGDQS